MIKFELQLITGKQLQTIAERLIAPQTTHAPQLTALEGGDQRHNCRVHHAAVVVQAHDVAVQRPRQLFAHNAQLLQVHAAGVADDLGEQATAHLRLFGRRARPELGRAQRRQLDVGHNEAGVRLGGQRFGELLRTIWAIEAS